MKLELDSDRSIEVEVKTNGYKLCIYVDGQETVYMYVTAIELSMIIHLLQTHLLSKQGKEA